MNSVIKYLNFLLDDNAEPCIPTKEDAREALRQLELFGIASGAVKTLIEHPGNKEGIAHAKRVLDYLEASANRMKTAADLLAAAEPVTNPMAARAVAAGLEALAGAKATADEHAMMDEEDGRRAAAIAEAMEDDASDLV